MQVPKRAFQVGDGKRAIGKSHAAGDAVIPCSNSRRLATALRVNQSPVLYDEIPGGHDAPLVKINWRKTFDFLERGK